MKKDIQLGKDGMDGRKIIEVVGFNDDNLG